MPNQLAATDRDRAVLVVEDDAAVSATLTDLLQASGYKVWQAETGEDAKAVLEHETPDLIVLDLMLPDVDGLVLCSNLKASRDVPIIICSALNEPRERVLGLKLGADDFIGKPFDIYEFEARVEAVLRRRKQQLESAAAASARSGFVGNAHAGHPTHERLRVGSLEVDSARRKVTVSGKTLQLTPTEYRLIAAMASRPNEILSRDELTRMVWGYADAGNGRTIDVHIRRLRVKLSELGVTDPPAIVSQRGFGYGLLDDREVTSGGARRVSE